MFRRVSIRLALLLGDLSLIPVALLLASWLRIQFPLGREIIPWSVTWPAWPVYAIAVLVWGGVFLVMDVYNLQKNLRLLAELQRLAVAHLAAVLAFSGALYFSFRDTSRWQVILFALTGSLLLVSFRLGFRLVLRLFGDKRYGTRRVAIVGAGQIGHNVARTVVQNRWTGLHLVGFIDDEPAAKTLGLAHLGRLDQTLEIVASQRINEIIFALPREAYHQLANLVADLQDLAVNVRVVPDFFDLVFLRSAVEDLGDMPLVTLREPALDPLQRLLKRLFDLVFSSLALLLSLPLLIVIAVLIKLDSPGPIIFKQRRVGEHGRLFSIYKFRTMVHDPETHDGKTPHKLVNGQPVHKFYDDPRVTRVGHFLRRTSLDELPQFVNILKGEMSLVGPRPELPWLVEMYEPWQRKRFEVPQGLTGWWQINGRSNKPMHLNTADDLYYIKNYSLWLDLQILWRTIRAVIERRGSF